MRSPSVVFVGRKALAWAIFVAPVEYYFVLIVSTLVIAALLALIFQRTRNLAFPLGVAFAYYLSLYGGWSIVSDRLNRNTGMRYEYLEAKLFAVAVDESYFWTLVWYGLFIIWIEIAVLFTLRGSRSAKPPKALPISLSRLLLFAASAGVISFLLIAGDLRAAHETGQSGYEFMKRGLGEVSSAFTIHQVLLRAASMALAIGVSVLCSGDEPRVLEGRRNLWIVVGYGAGIAGLLWVSFVLGYKSELFFAGVTGCLLYLVNARRPRRRAIAVGVAVGALLMGLVDLWRFVPPTIMAEKLVQLDFSEFLDAIALVSSSNEAFSSHFSLYGILHRDVPFTYGSSLVSLLASLIPRALWPDRPEDIYSYYVDRVQALPGQGYTIHHATGWYLNFGFIGILVGAVLLGWIWARLFRMFGERRGSDPILKYAFATIAPWSMTAFLPFLLHGGPEAYKGLLFEGLVIPTALLLFASGRFEHSHGGPKVQDTRRLRWMV